MKSKKRKRLLNFIMVILILIVAGSGIVTVGIIQGWFEKKTESAVTSGTVKGVVNIERNGIGYTLKEDTFISPGDIIETKRRAKAELLHGSTDLFVLNENTEIGLDTCEEDTVKIHINQGELFGDMGDHTGSFEVEFAGNTVQLSGTVFSVCVQPGSCTLNIYYGDVSVRMDDGTRERVKTGEALSSSDDENHSASCSVDVLRIESLNEFLITEAQNCESSDKLCFSSLDLQKILDRRAAEKQSALESAIKTENTVSETAEEKTGNSENESTNPQTEEVHRQNYIEEYVPDSHSQQSTDELPKEQESSQITADSPTCTISILCSTILDNLENLSEGKETYVPANGIILDTSYVDFTEGETVFDVLKRVCEYAGIQLEYSWTPVYNSYYVEGINHLYEFDCGNESGWMYKVNGWFPNYGCSSYELEDGDTIVWIYTCNGLGADVEGAFN